MGVAGAGKTTVGRSLAEELGWRFEDADDLHPEGNVEKMAAGVPLTEDDREPWLQALQDLVRSLEDRREPAIVACSALTRSFRRRLRDASPNVRYVYLRAERALLEERLHDRRGHYMKAEMLESQLRTLEEPSDAIVIEVGSDDPRKVVDRIRAALGV